MKLLLPFLFLYNFSLAQETIYDSIYLNPNFRSVNLTAQQEVLIADKYSTLKGSLPHDNTGESSMRASQKTNLFAYSLLDDAQKDLFRISWKESTLRLMHSYHHHLKLTEQQKESLIEILKGVEGFDSLMIIKHAHFPDRENILPMLDSTQLLLDAAHQHQIRINFERHMSEADAEKARDTAFETNITFSHHLGLNAVSKWVNNLRYFYYFQDCATHGYSGQKFILPILYEDKNDLVAKLSILGIEIKLIPEDSPHPIKGQFYSREERMKFKHGIFRFPEIEQPGWVTVFGIKCFVWVTEKHINITVVGNGSQEEFKNYQVAENDFIIALQLEDVLCKTEIVNYIDRDIDLDRRYISKRFYKEQLHLQ